MATGFEDLGAIVAPPEAPHGFEDLGAVRAPVAQSSDFSDLGAVPAAQHYANLASDHTFDPASQVAQGSVDPETGFQVQKLRDARPLTEKIGAGLATAANPSTWANAAKGVAQFGVGLGAAPLNLLGQFWHGGLSTVGRLAGANDFADSEAQKQLRDKAEAVLAGQNIEESLKGAGRSILNLRPNIGATDISGSTETAMPSEDPVAEEKANAAADEARARAEFSAKVDAAKKGIQLSQGRPLQNGAVAAITGATGTPVSQLTPESLEEAGAPPVRQGMIEAESAAANPENLLLGAAPELPGAQYLGGKLAQGLGTAAKIPGQGVDLAIKGARAAAEKLKQIPFATTAAKGAAAAAAYTVGIPAAKAAAVGAGLGAASKGLQWLGEGIAQQGEAAASGIPSALDTTAANARVSGQSALGTNAQRVIGDAATRAASTAIGMAPLNLALSEGDPETFAKQSVGAAAFGGAADLLHSTRPTLVEAARPALRQKGIEAQDLNTREGRASSQFIESMPEAQKNTAYELQGALQGLPVQNAQGEMVPSRMLVQSNADYQATLKRLGIDKVPQGGGQGFFWGPDGTAYINGEHSDFSDPENAAQLIGHEFAGHAAANMLQAAGAKGGPIYDGLIRSAKQQLYNQDGTPTPEFQRFIDGYNKAFDPTGQHQQIDANNPNSVDEFLAETAGRIISQNGAADIALPKNILDKVTDGVGSFMSSLTGVDPRSVGTGGRFDRTEVAKLSETVRDSLAQLAGMKLRPGEGEGAISRPQTPDEYVQELQDTLAKPRPTDTAENVKAWLKEQQQARKDLADFQGQSAGFPAAGRAPTPPSAPKIPAKEDAVKAMVAMGIKPTEAAQHVEMASQQLGPNADASALLAAAHRIRQGQPAQTGNPAIPQNIQTTSFNDPNGNRHTVTGISQESVKPGDFVARQDGKVMRVVNVRADGGLDTVFPATSNEQTTYPVNPGQYQVLTHETQTANEPLPAGSGVATKGDVVSSTEAPQAGDTAPSTVAVRPKVGPQIPSHPSGAPDIIDHILAEGGIVGKGKSAQAGADQYADQPENSKRGVYSQLYSGSETPDQMAQYLLDHHNVGDGSVKTMWDLIQKAIPERQNARKDISQEEQRQNTEQKEYTAQEKASVDKLVSDAEEKERAAIIAEGKSPVAKINQTRMRAAKIDAILDAIGDDETGLHRETDQFGNQAIIGRFDPENPYHKALADIGGGITKGASAKFEDFQNAQGKPVYIRYRSAKSDTAGTGGEATAKGVGDMGVRQQEYESDPAQSRTEGQPQHKVVIPLGAEIKSPSGSLIGRFLTLDNLLHNAASIFEGMKNAGIPNPYGDFPADQQRQLVSDAQAYAKNHANGYQGDGAGPIQQFPDSELPKVNPDYVPTTIPKERFDVLNMMMHNETAGKLGDLTARVQKYVTDGKEVPKSVSATYQRAQEAYALAEENNRWIDHTSGETNQLRQQLKAYGFDTSKSFKSPFETLLPKHILDISDKPIPIQEGDIPTVRPTGFDVDPIELAKEGLPNQKAVAAGFSPAEQTKRTRWDVNTWLPEERKNLTDFIDSREKALDFYQKNGITNPKNIREHQALIDKWGTEFQKATGLGQGEVGFPAIDKAQLDEAKSVLDSKNIPKYLQWAGGNTDLDDYENAMSLHEREKRFGDKDAPAQYAKPEYEPGADEIMQKWNDEPGYDPDEDANAQFSPEDTGKPEEGGNPGERLAREAEQAGVVLKIQDYKDLTTMKPETVARLRARIQQQTGKPARFQPDSSAQSENPRAGQSRTIPLASILAQQRQRERAASKK